MPTESLDGFGRRVNNFVKELEGERLKMIADKAGMQAKKIATEAAKADLGGDDKFSGWSGSNLLTRYDHVEPGVISFHPSKRSAGPWTVAEFGRNQAAGPRMVGPRLTKTGRVSKTKQRRYNGRTQGKGTASDALSEIEKQIPRTVDREVVKAIRKFFD